MITICQYLCVVCIVYVLCAVLCVADVRVWVYDRAFSPNWNNIYKRRQCKPFRLVQGNYPFILWLVNCNFTVKAITYFSRDKDRLARCCHGQFTAANRILLRRLYCHSPNLATYNLLRSAWFCHVQFTAANRILLRRLYCHSPNLATYNLLRSAWSCHVQFTATNPILNTYIFTATGALLTSTFLLLPD